MTRPPLRVIVRDEAADDIADAAVWYHDQQPGLGDEFLNEIQVAISSAAENPFIHRCLRRKPEVRRVLTQRFPFRVFFVRRDDAVIVIRVLHAARHDREWKSIVPRN